MARKRVEEVIAEFESWDDVNQALGTIGDNQRMVEGFEAEMQEKIDAAKAEAEAKSRIYLEGKYPPADIIAVGAGVKVLDTFWYEPDREKLERN